MMRTRRARAKRSLALPLLAALLPLLAHRPTRAADSAPANAQQIETGHELFKEQSCPQCHGFGGKGDGYLLPMLKEKVVMRDWTDPAQMKELSDDYLVKIIAGGGEPLGKNKLMLRYDHKLAPEQIRDVVVYIRSLAPPVSSPPPS